MAKLQRPKAGILIVRKERQLMIPLTKSMTTIGRRQTDIILDDSKASSSHAELIHKNNQYVLVDKQSTNGTFVNRRPISEHLLADQDVIEIGNSTLCFFKDLRDFHGESAEFTLSKSAQSKEDVEKTEATKPTTTRTVTQLETRMAILEGPNKGQTFKFRKSHVLIGRAEADLILLDLDTSRSHCLIEVLSPTVIYIRDLDSTNGTYLNGKKILSEKISSGDKIRLGNTEIKVEFH